MTSGQPAPDRGPGTGSGDISRLTPRRLVVAGTVLVDILLYLDDFPAPGTADLASQATVTAGAGYNVLAAATRLGLPAAFAGLVGAGPFGSIVRTALADLGVGVLLPLAEAGEDTGFDVGLVTSQPDSQPTFIGRPGLEARLTRADLSQVALSPGDAVYVSGYDLWYPEAGAAVADWIATLGQEYLFVFDPGPVAGQLAPARLDVALHRADLLSLTLDEAAALTGRPAGPPELAAELASRLPAGGSVIVRSGRDGCWVAGPLPPRRIPGRPAHVVDPTGAGDAHVAALLARLAAGCGIAEAAQWANVAASLAVTRQGPATGPTARELGDAMAEFATGQRR